MIGKLKGSIDQIIGNRLIIDINGIGYEVLCPERSIKLLEEKQSIIVYVDTIFRDETINLYGFLSIEERQIFRTLQTVQSVGSKLAMTILGFYSIKELESFIGNADEKSICAIPGVGTKVAKRIIVELKDRYSKQIDSFNEILSAKRNNIISALTNLGYSRTEALNLIDQIKDNIDEKTEIEELIKLALKRSNK
ncbi:MAG: Holliday junction branch migration protein RuvA [Alphaproteobacteria bacterium]|uniref:Holliday junction branch migration complex subunit RuvA n=1 Tax=PS1 clade bacterium TaxID=2175152 RepID=A0A368DQ15_9PROT|nr:MAG: Holliday junction branch migration protein RuvA [PS1 clade bacterium]|tara:strand:+ start:4890 stop:5471 length:582 start_codon:yes stop_codon:yes gene_type:complete